MADEGDRGGTWIAATLASANAMNEIDVGSEGSSEETLDCWGEHAMSSREDTLAAAARESLSCSITAGSCPMEDASTTRKRKKDTRKPGWTWAKVRGKRLWS